MSRFGRLECRRCELADQLCNIRSRWWKRVARTRYRDRQTFTFAALPDQQYFDDKSESKAEKQASDGCDVLTAFVMTLVGHVEDTLRRQQDDQNPDCVKDAAKGSEKRHVVTGDMPPHACDDQGRHRGSRPSLSCPKLAQVRTLHTMVPEPCGVFKTAKSTFHSPYFDHVLGSSVQSFDA